MRYFHRRAVCRKQRNRISSLQLLNGEWCSDNDTLRTEAVKYYESLFAADEEPIDDFPYKGMFPVLPSSVTQNLDDIPSVGLPQSDHSYCARSIAWARSFHGSTSEISAVRDAAPLIASQLFWKAPEQGWVCLNVDGAVLLQSGLGAIGGLARDSVGDWLVGFSKPVGHSDALHTELWAIYTGLKFA
ncbi:hypothetical protein V6N11_050978 [Hibiscus sabdariffa]|uniref:RNase H type-1 domain-containing protein n=1 Tax=Hibiscus sabdariffa TaxID=183260 RepID=A0ABR2R2Z1_9ROSI